MAGAIHHNPNHALIDGCCGFLPGKGGSSIDSRGYPVRNQNLVQIILTFVFLAHQAYLMTDAIIRSIVGVFHQKTLEWVTAADTDRRFKGLWRIIENVPSHADLSRLFIWVVTLDNPLVYTLVIPCHSCHP